MDLAALQIFKAVVDHGGVNRAAARLNRVPSNVTTRVKQLEETLGAKLFLREGRRMTLSSEGKVLLAYADQMLRLAAEAKAALADSEPRGTLRIGALESTSAARLPPVLAAYHARFPEVQIELVTGTSGALVERVLRQDVEAAFVAEPFPDAGLESDVVFVEELVLIAPKTVTGVRTARDIGSRTVIAFATGCSYRRRLEAWLGAAKVTPQRVMEFQSYHAIVACVAAGCGIAVVPRSVLAMTNAHGQVNVVTLPKETATARTRLVWRPGYRSIPLEAMRTLLRGKTQGAR